MRTTAVAVGVMMASLLLAAPTAGADPYSPHVNTDCRLVVDAQVSRGDRFDARALVDANAPFDVFGRVTFRITRDPGDDRRVVWERTVLYRASAAHVRGPVLSKRGRYEASVRFRATTPTVGGCAAAEDLEVGGRGLGEGDQPGDGETTVPAESATGSLDPTASSRAPDGGGGAGGSSDDDASPDDSDDDDGSWPVWLILLIAGILGGGGAVAAARRD
ncbi:hypothetical protein [Nocardioides stalactiti]|uniref:hypothetical protein n=1 Tax=Nocardioides stalactiti TaxID=2755356 RepID=UPI0016029321|nr:hypothetical protein [Nocardioides stalactiti]